MTYADKCRQRLERLTLTAISKTFVTWMIATVIFILFIGKEGWAEWLTFTAAACGMTMYREMKGGDNAPTYPDGGP